jgi:hypothetical protein
MTTANQVIQQKLNNPKQETAKFQHYQSSRIAMRMITDKGKKIIFTKFEFLTQDEEIITYLDTQIAEAKYTGRNLGITKGKLLTYDDIDPMAVLKRKHIAEYLASEQQELADKATGKAGAKDMGKTAGASAIKPTSTSQVAN